MINIQIKAKYIRMNVIKYIIDIANIRFEKNTYKILCIFIVREEYLLNIVSDSTNDVQA
jgi:hypothetical protein